MSSYFCRHAVSVTPSSIACAAPCATNGNIGLAGVAEQRHPPHRPARKRRAVKQAPDERFLHRVEHAGHVLVPAGESRTRLFYVTAIGPGFLRPRILLDNRDEIDIAHAVD